MLQGNHYEKLRYLSRTPEHVKVLLEYRADMPHSVLRGAASFASPQTVPGFLLRC